jgi:hypothetical protein
MMPHPMSDKVLGNFGQPTLPVYRIQFYPTSELMALDREFEYTMVQSGLVATPQ